MSKFKRALQNTVQEKQLVTGGYVNSPGTAVFTDRVYDKIVREAYNKNPFYYSAANLTADIFSDVDVVVEVNGEKVDDHRAYEVFDRPNDDQGGASFKRESILYYIMSGKCFTQIATSSDNKRVMLKNIAPKYVTVMSGGKFNPIGSFKVKTDGSDVPIAKEDMIYVKDFHPDKATDAHAPIMSAATTVDLNNAMAEWNLSILQNRGVPAYVYSGFSSSDEARQNREVNERNQNGFRNAGKDLYLSGNLKVEKLGFTAQEMDWLKGYQETGKNILMPLNVPPELLGVGKATYANFETAIKALVHFSIMPKWKIFIDAYNLSLAPKFGENVRFSIDENSISALQENMKDRISSAKEAFHSGLSNRGQAQDIAGVPRDGNDDLTIIPTNTIPINQ